MNIKIEDTPKVRDILYNLNLYTPAIVYTPGEKDYLILIKSKEKDNILFYSISKITPQGSDYNINNPTHRIEYPTGYKSWWQGEYESKCDINHPHVKSAISFMINYKLNHYSMIKLGNDKKYYKLIEIL